MIEDLEEAIRFNSELEAPAIHPVGHPRSFMSLSDLANVFGDRYDQLGRMDDLNEAIKFNRKALALSPLGHPNRSTFLSSLAAVLFTRYRKLGMTGYPNDLEDATIYHSEALALSSALWVTNIVAIPSLTVVMSLFISIISLMRC